MDVVVRLEFIGTYLEENVPIHSLVELLDPGAIEFLHEGDALRCESMPESAMGTAEIVTIMRIADEVMTPAGLATPHLTLLRGCHGTSPRDSHLRCSWRVVDHLPEWFLNPPAATTARRMTMPSNEKSATSSGWTGDEATT